MKMISNKAAALYTYRKFDDWDYVLPNITVEEAGLLADIYELQKNEILIAIRGTVDSSDWAFNLNYSKRASAYLDGSVHLGFATASELLTGTLKQELAHRWKLKDLRVRLVGHSLGAAIVTFLAPWLHNLGADVVSIVTYGSPRVGDYNYVRQWNKLFKSVTIRHVNSIDAVPHFPSIFQGFKHVSRLKYYDRNGTVQTFTLGAKFIDNFVALIEHIGKRGLAGIEYHKMMSYYSIVK